MGFAEFAILDGDERWILPGTDPLGKHPWYQAQSVERKIEIGKWRQANIVKVGLQFESMLIRGLMNYVLGPERLTRNTGTACTSRSKNATTP